MLQGSTVQFPESLDHNTTPAYKENVGKHYPFGLPLPPTESRNKKKGTHCNYKELFHWVLKFMDTKCQYLPPKLLHLKNTAQFEILYYSLLLRPLEKLLLSLNNVPVLLTFCDRQFNICLTISRNWSCFQHNGFSDHSIHKILHKMDRGNKQLWW